jgi:hypothetical protein
VANSACKRFGQVAARVRAGVTIDPSQAHP